MLNYQRGNTVNTHMGERAAARAQFITLACFTLAHIYHIVLRIQVKRERDYARIPKITLLRTFLQHRRIPSIIQYTGNNVLPLATGSVKDKLQKVYGGGTGGQVGI